MTCWPAMVAEWRWTDDLALVPRGSSREIRLEIAPAPLAADLLSDHAEPQSYSIFLDG
jgi:hypothetical protein